MSGNCSVLLILRYYALEFLHTEGVLVVGMTILPGVTPCGLTPGCDIARFQRACSSELPTAHDQLPVTHRKMGK